MLVYDLKFFDRNEVAHLLDHAQNLWCSLVLDRIVQFLNSEGLDGGLLTLWAVDRAAHLGDFDFSHGIRD
jgi:hypothetical protein